MHLVKLTLFVGGELHVSSELSMSLWLNGYHFIVKTIKHWLVFLADFALKHAVLV